MGHRHKPGRRKRKMQSSRRQSAPGPAASHNQARPGRPWYPNQEHAGPPFRILDPFDGLGGLLVASQLHSMAAVSAKRATLTIGDRQCPRCREEMTEMPPGSGTFMCLCGHVAQAEKIEIRGVGIHQRK